MKYVTELAVILGFTLLGELIRLAVPLPVPAGIYGLLLLFLSLLLGIVKLGQVAHTGHYLLEVMIVMFIAPGVGIITNWGLLSPVLLPYCVIVLISTVAVMAVTGLVAQRLMKKGRSDGKYAGYFYQDGVFWPGADPGGLSLWSLGP